MSPHNLATAQHAFTKVSPDTEFLLTLKSLMICSDVLLIWLQSKHFTQVEA